MRRSILLWLLAVLLLGALAIPTFAEDSIAEDFFGAADSLPEEIKDKLPEGFLEGDAESLGEAVETAGSFGALLRRVLSYASLGISDVLPLFASLLGILVLSAVFRTFRETVTGEGVRRAVDLVGACVTVSVLVSVQYDTALMVSRFFDSLTLLISSMAPMIATLYAMGGNVRTAVVGHGGLMTFLAIVETVASGTLLPVTGICSALAAASAVTPRVRLSGVLNLVKRCYTFFLGALMLLLTFTLSMQTTLAAASDNVAMRGAKMLAGSAIPVVGSSIGDTLKTVSGSIGFLKSTVGLGGVLLVAFLVVPPLVSVLLHRLIFMAAGVAADVLGCDNEARLIGSFVTVYGYFLAAICISAVTFIFLLTLFVRCRIAVGG